MATCVCPGANGGSICGSVHDVIGGFCVLCRKNGCQPDPHPRVGDVYRNDGIVGDVTLTGRNRRNDGWTTSNPAVELMDSGFSSGHHRFIKAGPVAAAGVPSVKTWTNHALDWIEENVPGGYAIVSRALEATKDLPSLVAPGGTPGAGEAPPRAVELHGKMMAKAEELWARAEATGCEEEQEAEQWEACAMAVEECAKMVAATPVAQRRPAPRGELRLLLALHIDNPQALTMAVEEMVQFVEADRRGEPNV